MLRIVASQGAEAAKAYFTGSLERGDYYLEDTEHSPGTWHGRGAAFLKLSGEVSREVFGALAENRLPGEKGRLTARTKSVRRVGYDLNFHAPKSVSLLAALSAQGQAIEKVFVDSVQETMELLEAEARTRVRMQGASHDRVTGNLIWARFIHRTSRPVDGIPDPHLHAHCFTFNATYDDAELKWKAVQLGDIKSHAAYYEAIFHSKLASRISALGYKVERRGRFWEIADFSPSLLRTFSRRTLEIERVAKEGGIVNVEEKAMLGRKTRCPKNTLLTYAELQGTWRATLGAKNSQLLIQHEAPIDRNASFTARDAVTLALESAFERASVVPERDVLERALRIGVGRASHSELKDCLDAHALIRRTVGSETLLTTDDVLSEEEAVLSHARAGVRRHSPLVRTPCQADLSGLTENQARVLRHILGSTDQITLVRGAAGTGKTTLMKRSIAAIEAEGIRATVLAPTAAVARDTLRAEGFRTSETVAAFLGNTEQQEEARGGLLWIDEAGLLGMRSLRALFETAERLGARVVLSGDYRQHASVERGDALRLLQSEGGLRWAELTEIQRQRGTYRDAIEALSRGDVPKGFKCLEELGAIREVTSPIERYAAAAKSYLEALRQRKSCLVVCPTHFEGKRVTAAIRQGRYTLGQLGPSVAIEVLRCRGLTEPERRIATSFTLGDVVQFKRACPGFQSGETCSVVTVDAFRNEVRVSLGGSTVSLPLDKSARFDVYEADTIDLAQGDLIRVTKNGRAADRRSSIHNGTVHEVASVSRSGEVRLADGRALAPDFRHLAHGYCVTSHAAQGRTVERVVVVQGSASYRASSDAQFYVSTSRGTREVIVFTDDRESLLDAVSKSGARQTASELVSAPLKNISSHIGVRRDGHTLDYSHDGRR